MSKTFICNDLHLGVQRTGGTTLPSAAQLRSWAQARYQNLLVRASLEECDLVVVNGDLTDHYDIQLGEGLAILETTKLFLEEHPQIDMVWGLGNHDLSKDSSKLGIVVFLGAILAGWFPERFRLVGSPQWVGPGLWMIPHLVNQERFDLALSQVPDDAKYLLLHCNYDNSFAGAQDHSLNITRKQARAFKDRGIKLVLGHEHQGRTLLGGDVIIVGNQFPTSVADCLAHGDAQKDGKKHALVIDGDQHRLIQTWSKDDADGWFGEIDWHELHEIVETGRGFVRVTGEAGATEASQVIKAISTFRQRAHSFVITNAVKVEGLEASDEELVTQEDIRQVDVMGLLLELLEPAQAEVVRQLLGRTEQPAEEPEDAAA